MNRITQFFVFLYLALSLQPAFAQQDELLPPEQAFALQGWVDGDSVVAEYKIADGYYMYRDAFKFDLETDQVSFGEPRVPDGKIKHDEFFGDVEIYRDRIAITLPLQYASDTPPQVIRIKTTGQGCADIGVCYPPLYQTLTMNLASTAKVSPEPYAFKPVSDTAGMVNDGVQELQSLLGAVTGSMQAEAQPPAMEPIEQPASSMNPLALLQALGDEIGLGDDDEIPPPDKAFQLAAVVDNNNVVQTEIQLYPNTYLYRDKMKRSESTRLNSSH